MKKIILGALVAILLLGGIGSMGGNKESGNSDSASNKVVVVEDAKKEEVKEEAVSDDTNNDAEEGQEVAESNEEEAQVEETEEVEEPEEESIEYQEVSVQEMVDTLESNALKAKETYEGKYIEVSGYLNNIDSSGDYITLYADEYSFTGVQCFAKNKDLKSQISNMSIGDTVTLRGKCTSVGEVLGYSVEIDSIDGYEEGEEIGFEKTDDGYIIVSANDLVEIIGENPLQAQNALKGQNVELTGKLGTIDSNGKYIGIDSDDEWSFVNIQCFIKNDDQKSQIMDMSSGDEVTIRGKITGVGEVLGYSIDIESIE